MTQSFLHPHTGMDPVTRLLNLYEAGVLDKTAFNAALRALAPAPAPAPEAKRVETPAAPLVKTPAAPLVDHAKERRAAARRAKIAVRAAIQARLAKEREAELDAIYAEMAAPVTLHAKPQWVIMTKMNRYGKQKLRDCRLTIPAGYPSAADPVAIASEFEDSTIDRLESDIIQFGAIKAHLGMTVSLVKKRRLCSLRERGC